MAGSIPFSTNIHIEEVGETQPFGPGRKFSLTFGINTVDLVICMVSLIYNSSLHSYVNTNQAPSDSTSNYLEERTHSF